MPLINQTYLALINLFNTNYLFVDSEEVIKLTTLVEGDPKASFSIATTPKFFFWGGALLHSMLGPLYLNPYLIRLSIKQGGTKYQFLMVSWLVGWILWHINLCR